MFQNNWNILRLCWEQFSLFWSTSQALYLGEIQPPPKYLHASNPLRFLPQKGVVAPQIDFLISSPLLGFGLRKWLRFRVVGSPNLLAVEGEEATWVQCSQFPQPTCCWKWEGDLGSVGGQTVKLSGVRYWQTGAEQTSCFAESLRKTPRTWNHLPSSAVRLWGTLCF